MSNTTKVIVGVIVVVVIAGLGLFLLNRPNSEPRPDSTVGGAFTHSVNEVFLVGLRASNLAVQVIDSLGKLVNPIVSDLDNTIPTVTETSTATLTADQICNNTILNISFKTATGTLTLPTAAAILADDHCLKNNGDKLEFAIRNSTSTGEFVLVGAASSTLGSMNLSSSTEAVNRTGTTTIQAKLTTFLRGYKISSSTDWIIWQMNSYR